MTRRQNTVRALVAAAALSGCLAPSAGAEEWRFGIGTGITSFSLDGDIGFPAGGGTIINVDLDNSDTSDLIESGFGAAGFARNGKWTIAFSAGTVTLEDSAGAINVEWDKTQADAAGIYNFAKAGRHEWGALFGLRHVAHDWEFTGGTTASVDESWTDVLFGATHAFPFKEKWSWTNRLDAGFGGSEGSFYLSSMVLWQVGQHWLLMGGLRQNSIEYGEASDIGQADFYYYDVDEPAIAVGFMYTW